MGGTGGDMTKWEYVNISLITSNLTNHQHLLNQYGREGWELVSVDNGTAYFRRPKQKTIAPSETKGKEAPSV